MHFKKEIIKNKPYFYWRQLQCLLYHLHSNLELSSPTRDCAYWQAKYPLLLIPERNWTPRNQWLPLLKVVDKFWLLHSTGRISSLAQTWGTVAQWLEYSLAVFICTLFSLNFVSIRFHDLRKITKFNTRKIGSRFFAKFTVKPGQAYPPRCH